MEGFPPVYIVLTTYLRTDTAVRTIRALKEKLQYPNYGWYVSDDGSPQSHIDAVMDEIGGNPNKFIYSSARKGVGNGMNHCLHHIFNQIGPLVLMMEDDWELTQPLDLTPYVRLLMNSETYGMVRFGYMAPNLLLYTISEEGKMLYRVEPNKETYRVVGHPSLRHMRFHEVYGYYDEGLAPGMTELSMCGKVNLLDATGPKIVIPGDYNCMGVFAHIGSDSLADMEPGK